MSPTRDEIEQYVLTTLQELARDWDYSRPLDRRTCLFSDLGFESLDAVVLGAAVQEHYRRPMPFAQLFTDVGQRPRRELLIEELVEFVARHLAAGAPEPGVASHEAPVEQR
jgi:acyl carrier protein